jgi:TonB family protein
MKTTTCRCRIICIGIVTAAMVSGCAMVKSADDPQIFTGDYYALSEADVRPVATYKVSPVYPPDLQRMHIGGAVMISVLIDEHGKVESTELENAADLGPNDQEFGAAALAAIRMWRFRPGMKFGVPVRVAARIPVVFGSV